MGVRRILRSLEGVRRSKKVKNPCTRGRPRKKYFEVIEDRTAEHFMRFKRLHKIEKNGLEIDDIGHWYRQARQAAIKNTRIKRRNGMEVQSIQSHLHLGTHSTFQVISSPTHLLPTSQKLTSTSASAILIPLPLSLPSLLLPLPRPSLILFPAWFIQFYFSMFLPSRFLLC